MLDRIDHLGIAVHSIEERLPFWTQALGLARAPAPVVHVEEVPTEKVRVAMLRVGESRIELLEATSPDSVIAAFVRDRGEGVHHVCFAVRDLEEALREVLAAGGRIVGAAPRPGAGGSRVAFVHPKSSGGVLVELKEDARAPAAAAGATGGEAPR